MATRPKCKEHPSDAPRYNEKHDAHFCSTCDTWNEQKCDDSECELCSTRPSKPSEVPP